MFVVDYPLRWAEFFSDLLQTLPMGHLAADMFLRILKQIDLEVVDRDIVHTPAVSIIFILSPFCETSFGFAADICREH